MAAAFNTSVSSLENELTQLILDGQISARIDSHAKVNLIQMYSCMMNSYIYTDLTSITQKHAFSIVVISR